MGNPLNLDLEITHRREKWMKIYDEILRMGKSPKPGSRNRSLIVEKNVKWMKIYDADQS